MSTGPDRDRDVERMLRQALPAGATVSADCLDAETLAAWADAGLDARARAVAETHVAGCARCQALLAVIVRTEPARPIAAPWWRAPLVRWLAPAALVASGVTVWVLLPGPAAVAPTEERAVQARAEPPSPQAGVESSPALPRRERPVRQRVADAASPGESQVAPKRAAQAPAPALAEEVGRIAATNAVADERASGESRDKLTAGAAKASPGAPAPAAAPLAAQGGARDIASPDPAERWRIRGTTIDYTTDNGTTWERRPVPANAGLTTGISPARSVCWIVGRAGTILLTTSGVTWTRLPFPDAADLVAIDARDARAATVTTADGRVFETADAGATWQLR